MTRNDYMSGKIDHQTYYLAVGDAIGREAVEKIVRMISTPLTFKKLIASDKHLNNIPLGRWDAMHPMILYLVHKRGPDVMTISWSGQPLKPGTIRWSLSDTVCVLKASARRLAEEYQPSEPPASEASTHTQG